MADTGADPRRLVANDLLCYVVNKLSRLGKKPVKTSVVDFFAPDDVTAAKEMLYAEIEALQIDKFPKMIRRRKDLANRTAIEAEDILVMLTRLDEVKAMDRLPLFVSVDPDKMPSAKLREGDMQLLLMKLAKLDDELQAVKALVVKNNGSVNANPNQPAVWVQGLDSARHQSKQPALARTDPASARQFSGLASSTQPSASHRIGLGSESDLLTSEFEEATDDVPWSEATRRKRRRQHTSPPHGGQSAEQGVIVGGTTRPSQLPNKVTAKPKVKTLVGASATSTLQAAKNLQVPKAVFCLSNIDSSYSDGDIKAFVLGLGIRALTCFELKPAKHQPEGNKSFRLCIIAEDKNKLFDRENWPVGVTLREWRHKPKEDRGRGGREAEGKGLVAAWGRDKGLKVGVAGGGERKAAPARAPSPGLDSARAMMTQSEVDTVRSSLTLRTMKVTPC